eukprot:m.71762 g.71762  ORF g.71762 m.71762 type:complete len:68 (-) comp13834_c0_seq1:3836-4039(-)
MMLQTQRPLTLTLTQHSWKGTPFMKRSPVIHDDTRKGYTDISPTLPPNPWHVVVNVLCVTNSSTCGF